YWFFEASFPIKLVDEKGNELGIAIAQAQSDWMTEDFVPFEAELHFELPVTEKGTLILEKDNPSGLLENADELRIPVKFKVGLETMTIKVYFNNDKLDPEFSCNKVFPVEREISKTQAVAMAALKELLKGTTQGEKEKGFFTNINSGVKIQSLTIENGVAKVEFDEQLEFQVGGSCRVAAIRAQITETLKQFPTVDSVIISINGRTEDILQP
ncbi:GerMN domain-containing protein, partial [Patescibacteria group bacterium]|nr:GerMN domain-containing protein [Patescibacteria group bacterium]